MEVDETYQKMLEKLREHCEREKMSIYALAKNTNLSTSSLSNLLNGKTKPYVYTLLLICDALSISITDLADKDVSMTEDLMAICTASISEAGCHNAITVRNILIILLQRRTSSV